MRRSIALGMATAAAVAATTVGGASATTPATDGLEFGACPEDISKPYPDMRCATLDVPLDHNAPDGEQVQLLVSKLPAKNPDKRRGSLVTNPGGPGGPGIAFNGRLAPALPPEVLDSYDLIGFDTRNTAHSTPITCVDPEKFWQNPLPDPDDPAMRKTHWDRAQQYADGCQDRAGKYLPHLTTENNARDLDQIRQALGEDKISYLGYSYGTYLGATYGQLFPDRVDRMILDSAVNPDPKTVWYGVNLNQDVAAQKRLGIFFDWIAQYDQTFHLGTDRAQVQQAWDGIQAELRKQPHGELGPWEFVQLTFDALYGESSWTPLAKAMSAFHAGDDKPLIDSVEPMDEAAETQNAIYNAVECADAPWPTDQQQWEQDSKRLAEDYPLAAWYNSWGVAPCAKWHGPHHDPIQLTGEGLPPVLMFNSVNDVATPYDGAQVMHEALPSSVFVTEKDAGKHGVYALASNPEANKIGTEYLVNGNLPDTDIEIPGHPLPDPTAPETTARTIDLR